MKVRELILALDALDPDLTVTVTGESGDFWDIGEVVVDLAVVERDIIHVSDEGDPDRSQVVRLLVRR